jgi:hypothetical protein
VSYITATFSLSNSTPHNKCKDLECLLFHLLALVFIAVRRSRILCKNDCNLNKNYVVSFLDIGYFES